jgi:DNA-binding transcriptional ArsR family regulator
MLRQIMPFEVIDTLDPLTPLVEFKTSPVYELLIGIRTIIKPPRWHESWTERARAALPPKLLTELTYLYAEFSDGGLYLELPVDYPESDVSGFFKYMRTLSNADFIFYLLGRIISRSALPDMLDDGEALTTALIAHGEHYEWYGRNLAPILSDIGAFRDRLVDAWEQYWKLFFQLEIAGFEPMWSLGIKEKQTILDREGGRGLLEKVTGRPTLPPELPPGMPITSITLIPVCLLPSRVYRFYGYGNITILFDPQYTEERKIAVENAKNEAASIFKALDDDTRLKILRMIAQNESRLHGKIIAERLGISASAVSRHLALLKEGQLIVEEPQKNLITYRFEKETILGLVDKLLDYLYS